MPIFTMNLNPVIKTSFILSLLGLAINIFSVTNKNFRVEGGMLMVLVPQMVFIVAAGYEVNTSLKIQRSEKIMWIVGFVLTGLIAGTAYMLSGRKRIMSTT